METTFIPLFYSQFMEKTPLLTREEEIQLSKDVHGKNEKRKKIAINKFVESNIRLAVKIVDDFSWYSEKEDLLSEAMIGLQMAAKKYDAKFGAKFSTYSAYYIKRKIMDYIKKSSMVSMSHHGNTLYFQVQKVIKKLENEMGRDAKIEEIAEEIGTTTKRVEEILNYKFSYIPLDSPIQNAEGDTSKTISDTIRDENAVSPDKEAEKQNDFLEARDFFSHLNEREVFILKKRFGFDGEEPMILEDIGNVLNVTRERVRQLQDMALKKIKKKFNEKNNALHSKLVLA